MANLIDRWKNTPSIGQTGRFYDGSFAGQECGGLNRQGSVRSGWPEGTLAGVGRGVFIDMITELADCGDGAVFIDNHQVENLIRPWA